MKRLLCMLLILGGCQATNLSMDVNLENGSNAVTTDAVASAGGLSTYGSGSDSTSSNTMGGDSSGQIESAGNFGGEAGGGASEGGLEP